MLIKKRVEFAREMLSLGPDYLRRVIWSDETTVRKCPKDKEKKIWTHKSVEKKDLPVNPQIHSGGFSVMFWGCFSFYGLGPLVALDDSMNASRYVDLLKETVIDEIKAAAELSGEEMILMQDNAPCHKARQLTAFLAESNVKLLPWPAQSPDLNPIENLWAIVKRRRDFKFGVAGSRAELIEQVFSIWNEIDLELCQKLASSVPNRLKECISLNGKVTKY